jgi:aryl-alcohol dehydrogenase-like predicted oxidoreductase
VTNIRNTRSANWRRWLGPENRCVVPFTSFSEPDPQPDGRRPPAWFAFADIVRSGKALYVSATTMPTWSPALALAAAAERHLPRFISMQCEYNPAHRECERELAPLCRHSGIGMIPFSLIAPGFLAADRRDPANATPIPKPTTTPSAITTDLLISRCRRPSPPPQAALACPRHRSP